VGGELDISVFDVEAITASGSNVAVHLRIESRLTKNGQALTNDAVHFWTFNDKGQIKSYRHYNDTAAELRAWRG
jgi:ketosteroid isomerase-like protein